MVVQGDPLATECRRLVWPRIVARVGPWVPSLLMNPTVPPEAMNLWGEVNVVAVIKPSLARSPPKAKMAGRPLTEPPDWAPGDVNAVADEVEEECGKVEVG